MTTTNRETVRDAFVSMLTTALVGTGKPAQAVYGYLKADLGGQSPVVCVASAGTDQEKRAVTSRQKNYFYLNIHTFTLYAKDASYGEDDVEDIVDLLEMTIRSTISANLNNQYWSFIEYDGRSLIDSVIISGEEYRREVIQIRLEVYDN